MTYMYVIRSFPHRPHNWLRSASVCLRQNVFGSHCIAVHWQFCAKCVVLYRNNGGFKRSWTKCSRSFQILFLQTKILIKKVLLMKRKSLSQVPKVIFRPEGLRTCNVIKKRFQRRCFPVKFAKFLRTSILKNICEQLLLLQFLSHGPNLSFFVCSGSD